jgi:hypothetical protein
MHRGTNVWIEPETRVVARQRPYWKLGIKETSNAGNTQQKLIHSEKLNERYPLGNMGIQHSKLKLKTIKEK